MDEMVKIPILFIDVKTLIESYRKNSVINYNNLGVFTDQKIILTQVLYQQKRIISRPYTLFALRTTRNIERVKIIEYFIEELIIKNHDKGNTNRTISTAISKCINFIDWCNIENISFMDNIKIARDSFVLYTNYLRESIRVGKYSQGEAHTKHMSAFKMLNSLFDDSENIISSGIEIIQNKRNNKVERSSEEDQKYHFNFYNAFFHQVTDFLLDKKEYPFLLKTKNKETWCLPSRHNFIHSEKQSPMAFNIVNGEIRKEEEIYKKFNLKYMRDARWAKKRFLETINNNNTDFNSKKRLYLGSMALMAYYIQFLTITGMNDSTAATLLWDKNFEIANTKQKFKNIKYRAGNKIVEFQIQNKFIKDFKKFLLLRKYLLKDNDFEYLFFVKNGENAQLSKRQKQGAFSSIINQLFIDTIEPDLPRINSKELRVNKTNQVIKDNGIIAASQLAQSSVNTIIGAYLGESQKTTDEQLGEYFKQLNINMFKQDDSEKDIVVGRCKSPNNPKSDVKLKSFNIDCSKSEGCLFCEHYGMHADEIDINKIYSLKFVINESRYASKNEDHFNGVYGVVLSRIENIISSIISENKQSIESMKAFENKVFIEEELHPYWEHKLNTLIKMGVI